MSNVAFIRSGSGSLSIIVNDHAYSVDTEHPNYSKIQQALKNLDKVTEKQLVDLIDVQTRFVARAGGGLSIVNGAVVDSKGNAVDHVVCDRILKLVNDGFDAKPALNFLERVLKNPSYNSKTELYDFLIKSGCPLTQDGYVLAYKAIRNDWTDKHTGTIKNTVGSIVRMNRSDVDDCKGHHCSRGLHVGGLPYVRSFASGNDRIVIVKFDPMNAVSVPTDDAHKLRVCEYEVVSEFVGELTNSVYDEKAQAVDKYYEKTADDWDEDWYDENDVEEDESLAYNVASGKVVTPQATKSPEILKTPTGGVYEAHRSSGGQFARKT